MNLVDTTVHSFAFKHEFVTVANYDLICIPDYKMYGWSGPIEIPQIFVSDHDLTCVKIRFSDHEWSYDKVLLIFRGPGRINNINIVFNHLSGEKASASTLQIKYL